MELGSMRSLVYLFAVMLTAQLLVQANCRRKLYRGGYFSIKNRDRDIEKLRQSPRRKLQLAKFGRCRGYHSTCVPWSKNPRTSCCEDANLTCKCNLWMQNCKCTSKMWGR